MNNSQVKILLLTHKFYPDVGGTEANSEFLANAFTNFGATVHVVTWTQEMGNKNFQFKVIRNPSVKQLIAEHRWANVIFENSPTLRMSWLNLFIKKPLIVALNTWIGEGNKMSLQAKLKLQWLKRALFVIAVSRAIRDRCWAKAVIIENAYNDQLFLNKHYDNNNKKSFAFLGRLVSDKGADMAINAMAALKKIKEQNANLTLDINLTIIGQGSDLNKLKEQTVSLDLVDNVSFVGTLTGDNLVKVLNNHKYLLVPSVWEEPFGIVALEGMACGCIPIVSNGGGLPDAVGNAGVVFERNNLDDFVNKIFDVVQNKNLEDKLRLNALPHLKNHSTIVVAEKYFELIKHAYKANIK